MYHSHTYQEEAFSLYASFIRNVLAGDTKYKDLVIPVIENAHLLANGERNFYTVDRKNYAIITYLVEKDPTFFRELDTASIDDGILKSILDMIAEQKELLYA